MLLSKPVFGWLISQLAKACTSTCSQLLLPSLNRHSCGQRDRAIRSGGQRASTRRRRTVKGIMASYCRQQNSWLNSERDLILLPLKCSPKPSLVSCLWWSCCRFQAPQPALLRLLQRQCSGWVLYGSHLFRFDFFVGWRHALIDYGAVGGLSGRMGPVCGGVKRSCESYTLLQQRTPHTWHAPRIVAFETIPWHAYVGAYWDKNDWINRLCFLFHNAVPFVLLLLYCPPHPSCPPKQEEGRVATGCLARAHVLFFHINSACLRKRYQTPKARG